MISFDTTEHNLPYKYTHPIQNNSSPNAQIIFSLREPLSELYKIILYSLIYKVQV